MNDNAIPSATDDVVRVFVSYARDDRRWLDPDYRFSLIPFLMESLRRHKVAFWFDKELKPGDEFKRHIESQIDQSQIALLIVSQSFLNSEFIENREMPRIAERAQQGKMIVVPVLVEPCDWSEYPFLADRQMVPSSPLIEYTESEPQWAKVRFQILDGLKAQLKRIREAPQAHAHAAALNAYDAPPVEELDRSPRKATEQEATEREAAQGRLDEPQRRIPMAAAAKARDADPADAGEELATASIWARVKIWAVPVSLVLLAVLVLGSALIMRHLRQNTAQPEVGVNTPTGVGTQTAPQQQAGPESGSTPTPAASTSSQPSSPATGSSLPTSGKVWVRRGSGTRNDLLSIFGTSDGRRLWAVGWIGKILESDDGGATWTPRKSGTANNLWSVFGTSDGKHLWAVGDRGTILESGDGGTTWTARNVGTNQWLNAIFGTSDGKHLWAVGTNGTIVRSDDGGATWMARYSGTTQCLFSIFGTSDGQRLWAVGESGTILESDDGGATWVTRNSGTTQILRSISGTSDGQHLWVVGTNGAIVESDDGGARWSARKSGTTNDLYSIFGTSDGKHLWAVGLSGTILGSGDGGTTWTARNVGTNQWLNAIFGTSDGKHLWAVGTNGTILELDR
jgi:photosystem II stability/assembly factor-like uncharacterized protein